MDDWTTIEQLDEEHCEALVAALGKSGGIVQLGELRDELGWTHNQAVEITGENHLLNC